MIKGGRKNSKILNFHIKGEHPILGERRTIGQKAADKLTTYAGSWTFIFIFFMFLIVWMIINTFWIIFGQSWDPYPFILLNLALSCLAAIQAPIILMSQNREAQKDRIRVQYDYAVNRKAEKEIQIIQKEIKELKRILTKKR